MSSNPSYVPNGRSIGGGLLDRESDVPPEVLEGLPDIATNRGWKVSQVLTHWSEAVGCIALKRVEESCGLSSSRSH
jgi:hypothetical protein